MVSYCLENEINSQYKRRPKKNIITKKKKTKVKVLFKLLIALIFSIYIGLSIFELCNLNYRVQVYCDNVLIATTQSIYEFNIVVREIKANINPCLARQLETRFSIVPILSVDKFVTRETLKNSIYAQLAGLHLGVYINNNLICNINSSDKDAVDLLKVLNDFKDSYKDINLSSNTIQITSDFNKSVEIKPTIDDSLELLSNHQIVNILKSQNDLKIITKYIYDFKTEIPYQIKYIDSDNNIFCRKETIRQKGSIGLKHVHKELTTINNDIQNDQMILKEEILKNPVDEIIEVSNQLYFIRPTHGTVTSRFGWRQIYNRNHNGIDIGNNHGTEIRAAESGTVREISRCKTGYGNLIIIEHPENFCTYYAHLASFAVKLGQRVIKGQQIGRMGKTGRSTGTHLHFEIRKNDVPLDPQRFIINME